jgi:hypothetical protein
MDPVSDAVLSSIGDTVLVEVSLHAGVSLTTAAANELLIEGSVNRIVPIHSKRLETTRVTTITITLRYRHTMKDANLGFFKSSLHK